jgi:hypothetical protein
MATVLSKEAELKADLAATKRSLSAAEQQNIVLSKQAGHAQGELEKQSGLAASHEALKKADLLKQSEIAQLKSQIIALQAQAEKADSVLAVARDLKSLLAAV